MDETDSPIFDLRLRDSVESIRRAWARVPTGPSPGDIPSGEETRELLGLFARLQSAELRQAVIGLMRAIAETGIEAQC